MTLENEGTSRLRLMEILRDTESEIERKIEGETVRKTEGDE